MLLDHLSSPGCELQIRCMKWDENGPQRVKKKKKKTSTVESEQNANESNYEDPKLSLSLSLLHFIFPPHRANGHVIMEIGRTLWWGEQFQLRLRRLIYCRRLTERSFRFVRWSLGQQTEPWRRRRWRSWCWWQKKNQISSEGDGTKHRAPPETPSRAVWEQITRLVLLFPTSRETSDIFSHLWKSVRAARSPP